MSTISRSQNILVIEAVKFHLIDASKSERYHRVMHKNKGAVVADVVISNTWMSALMLGPASKGLRALENESKSLRVVERTPSSENLNETLCSGGFHAFSSG